MCDLKIVSRKSQVQNTSRCMFHIETAIFRLFLMQINRILTVSRVALKTVSSTIMRYTVIWRVTHFWQCVAL